MKTVEKPWGKEIWWAKTSKYLGKILYLNADSRTSLQYHEKKHESIYILKGKVRVEIEEGNLVSIKHLVAGECLEIKPLKKHRFYSHIGATILEVSTPEYKDVVRLKDDYGRI